MNKAERESEIHHTRNKGEFRFGCRERESGAIPGDKLIATASLSQCLAKCIN